MSVFDNALIQQEKTIAKLQAQYDALTPEERKAALDYYDANIDRWEEEHAANAKTRSNLEQKVLDFVKKDPIKAKTIVDNPIQIVTEPELITEAVKEIATKGLEESTQPIWERDSTVKILGEEGADKLQDVLNPARWAENAIDSTGLSSDTKKLIKDYLPVAIAGGAALLIIKALKN